MCMLNLHVCKVISHQLFRSKKTFPLKFPNVSMYHINGKWWLPYIYIYIYHCQHHETVTTPYPMWHSESQSKFLMTLVASTNLLMSSIHRRWLTQREICVVQGFPVNTLYTYGVPCSSFSLRDHQLKNGSSYSPWPSRRATCELCGNSMHTAVSGLVMLFTITQVIMDPQHMWLQHCSIRDQLRVKPPSTPQVVIRGTSEESHVFGPQSAAQSFLQSQQGGEIDTGDADTGCDEPPSKKSKT